MSLSAEQIQTFLDELRPRVQGELRSDSFNKMLYSTDASIYQVEPYGVLVPKVMEDVHVSSGSGCQAWYSIVASYRW